jgi:hypothetical protein
MIHEDRPMRRLNRRERRALAQARSAAPVHAPDSASPRRGTREERSFLARYPRPSLMAWVMVLLSILVGNTYLYWLIANGALTVTGLVLLVMVEAILLGVMAQIQLARIPTAHRPEPAQRFDHAGQAVGVWSVAIAVFGGVYWMWIFMIGELPVLQAYLRSPQIWMDSGILVALAITVTLGLAGAVGDAQHYRRHGKAFVSTLAIESSGRRVLLCFGAMMIALPLMTVFFGILGGLHWLSKRPWVGTLSNTTFATLALAALGIFLGSFFLLAHAVDTSKLGLAGVYLLNKVIAESLFALLPMLAHRRAQSGDAASDGAGSTAAA